MSKVRLRTDKLPVRVHRRLGQYVAFLVLAVLASCGGEQSPLPEAPTEYLEFRAIPPGPRSDFDQLYALTGDYASPAFAVRPEGVPGPIATGPGDFSRVQRLRIFHINDLHHHLSDQLGNVTEYRAARISKLIQDGRQLSPDDEAVLFISAGDDAAGTRFDELIGYEPSEFIMHAGYETYSAIGMDVAVLGNHEFDWGTDLLKLSVTKSAAFPVISSNVWNDDESWPVYGSLVGTINGYRIALVGFTPPDALPVQSLQSEGYKILKISEQLKKLIPVLDPYVDFYILVTHLGYDGEIAAINAAQKSGYGDIAVARQLSELTRKPAIIVGGHTHTILNKDGLEPANVVNDIPILQAGEFGQWLGDATVTLATAENTVSASYDAHLIAIDANSGQDAVESSIDTELQSSLLVPMERLLIDKFSEAIGGSVGDSSLSAENTNIDRYSDESALLDILTDAIVSNSSEWAEGQVDFAAINATSISGGLEAGGGITYGDIFGLMPYADTVYLLKISGQQIKDIVNNNAGRIRRREEFIPNGGDLDPAIFHGGGFLQFSAGIRYAIVVDPASGNFQARNITLNGQPVESVLGHQFTVAVPRYVATGRGNWSGEPPGVQKPGIAAAIDMQELVAKSGYDTGRVWRSELIAYFKTHRQEITNESREFKDHRVQMQN
jgi:2',3'-cyclic-nucleotide 2'-phosphodiesterase (5'-nucleotidase family)